MTQRQLPWKQRQTDPRKSCFIIPTELKESSIKNAGNGTFSKLFVTKGTVMVKSKIVSVYDTDIWHWRKCIRIRNIEEILYLIKRYQEEFTDLSMDEIIDGMSHFVSSPDGKYLYLLCSSAHVNHSVTETRCIVQIEGDYLIGTAVKNIDAGNELYSNYYEIRIPVIFDMFFKRNNKMTINGILDKNLTINSRL